MDKFKDMVDMRRIAEIVSKLDEVKAQKKKDKTLTILAVIGVVAVVLGLCFAIYKFFTPDYLDDFDEDFDDDDIEDDFFEDEE
ncbi:hypothetical protein SAMN05216249_1224 [Acetitomaculum ruminis DSM 5522]|uniref:DUF4366 domain-containing protein n=1 Tax=Acetitomaculum ruminis DSM 5522 TaxID=1120918 RepID=A0A1I1A6G0_9FIRM|nr:DUF4366 domain-containing protein [Acetitomaculum ruminis]SFB33551.1 hypothetical protein SAMN05216249_1224 [Acetitomaculum ruminis DSM 5522]